MATAFGQLVSGPKNTFPGMDGTSLIGHNDDWSRIDYFSGQFKWQSNSAPAYPSSHPERNETKQIGNCSPCSVCRRKVNYSP